MNALPQAAPLLSLMTALELVRKELDPEMQVQTLSVLLTVASAPGITMKELSQRLHLAQSSCSRNVAALSKWHRLGRPGLDLLVATEDPAERRRKIVRLTTRGERFIETLQRKVEAAQKGGRHP